VWSWGHPWITASDVHQTCPGDCNFMNKILSSNKNFSSLPPKPYYCYGNEPPS